jgi:hypothetical protein
MNTPNSHSQALRQRNWRPMFVHKMVTFILCLTLLLGGMVSIKTAASYQPSSAPQSATPAPVNRIEQAATPRAFRSISFSNNPGKANLNLNGEIILGEESDSLNPVSDRLVIALGPSVTVLEPGSMRPSGQSNRVWTYQNPSHPSIRKVILQRHSDQSWQFEISTCVSLPENRRFYLRIGNDWGGINLNTREMLLQMQFALNFAFQSQAMIGSAGGTVQATDTSGVVISLNIPPGALAEETFITATPLESSALIAPSGALHPGVKFQPEGLQFARPATLTFDFSATDRQITNKDFIFLMTSPMTMLPLYGSANPATKTLSALVHHFSGVQPGPGGPAFSDPAAWANAALASGQNLTLEELQSIAALAAVQQQQGCQQDCIDGGLLTQRATESITALVAQNCANDTATPTDAGLGRYIELEVVAQQLGADVPAIRTCMEGVLRALIEKAATEGMNDPSDTTLQRVIDLWGRAEQLSFPNLVTLARQKTEDVFRALIDRDGVTAAADPSDPNLRRLLDLKARAQLLGFADHERQALVKVAAGVRVIVARASSMCSTDEVAARREFLRAQTWHAAVSLDPTVDPTLSQAINDAINDCGGPEMKVKVSSNGGALGGGTGAFALNPDEGGKFVNLSLGESSAFMNYGDGPLVIASPPLQMRAEVSGGTWVEWNLTQPERNVLAWDVAASVSGNAFRQTHARGMVIVDLTFSKAGTLRIEGHSQWLEPGVGFSSGAGSYYQEITYVRDSTGYLVQRTKGWHHFGHYAFQIPASSTLTISGPGTKRLAVEHQLLGAGGQAFGQGRKVTITFTPQP